MSSDQERIIDKIRRARGYLHPSRTVIYERDPRYLEIYHDLFTHVMQTRKALNLKVKELIIVAINAATNYEEGLAVHIRAALNAGATEDEIFEAIETASLPGGIHTMTYALPIFKKVCEDFRKGGAGC
jgi:AhpD family alkylhydroperoxidase